MILAQLKIYIALLEVDIINTKDLKMKTENFSINVDAVSGFCGVGEKWAKNAIENNKTPVLSCEGPCIRGEIARVAANMVAKKDSSCRRACHGELFFVPHSSIATWIKESETIIMIDGCFLKCHGRVLANLVSDRNILHIDASAIHKAYPDIFLYDDVPEADRRKLAEKVADKTISMLISRSSSP
ncbi:MAG: putative zinc-binding protein [Sedimenticola sp.]